MPLGQLLHIGAHTAAVFPPADKAMMGVGAALALMGGPPDRFVRDFSRSGPALIFIQLVHLPRNAEKRRGLISKTPALTGLCAFRSNWIASSVHPDLGHCTQLGGGYPPASAGVCLRHNNDSPSSVTLAPFFGI